jgi:hypothetical protein
VSIEYLHNNIYLDSTEETETEDDEGANRSIRSNSQRMDFNQTTPYLANDRKNTAVSYRGTNTNNSLTQLDPFARPIHTTDHYYRKRPNINKYKIF